jgi:hypothetical protein
MSKESKRRGVVIRVSREVEVFLRAKQRKVETYDALLRRFFGLPTKKGKEQPLRTFYVIPDESHAPLCFTSAAVAKGEAVRQAVRAGTKKVTKVITVREAV